MAALGAITIVGLSIHAGWTLLINDMCSNTIQSQSYSPDHALKVIVFTRDCGATTGFSTQVSILGGANSLPNDAGNVFVTNDGCAGAHWSGNRKVTVVYDHHAQVFTHKKNITVPYFPLWQSVEIEYTPY